jgi:hypothetical protein
MAFQFPASPTIGQIFVAASGAEYKWTGSAWEPISISALDQADGDARYVRLDASNRAIATQLTPPLGLHGGFVIASVAANAMLLELRTWDGSVPAANRPMMAVFLDPGSSNGNRIMRPVTAPVTLSVPAGATFNHFSGINQHLFVYLIDATPIGGGVEFMVSNMPPDFPDSFFSQRAIGTAVIAGAVSPFTAYSAVARNPVTKIPVAKLLVNQPTAGQWTAAPLLNDPAPFALSGQPVNVERSVAQAITANVPTQVQFDVAVNDPDNVFGAFVYRPNIAGYYHADFALHFGPPATNTQGIAYIRQSGAVLRQQDFTLVAVSASDGGALSTIARMNGTSDFIEFLAFYGSGGLSINGGPGQSGASCYRISRGNS